MAGKIECDYCVKAATHLFKEGRGTWLHWKIGEKGLVVDSKPNVIKDINEVPDRSEVRTCDEHIKQLGAAIGWDSETLLD